MRTGIHGQAAGFPERKCRRRSGRVPARPRLGRTENILRTVTSTLWSAIQTLLPLGREAVRFCHGCALRAMILFCADNIWEGNL